MPDHPQPSGEGEMVRLPVQLSTAPTVWASRLFNWERQGPNLFLSFAEVRIDPTAKLPAHLLVVARVGLPFSEIDAVIAMLQEAKAQSKLVVTQSSSGAMN